MPQIIMLGLREIIVSDNLVINLKLSSDGLEMIMSKFSETIAVISVLIVLLFTGCGNKHPLNVDEVKGGYVEQAIDLNNQLYSISNFYKINGEVVAYDYEKFNLVPVSGKTDSFVNYLNGCDINYIYAVTDSCCFVNIIDPTSNAIEYMIIKNDKTKIPVKIKENQFVNCADISDDGRIFAVIDNKLNEIDAKDGSLRVLANTGYMITSFDIVNNCIFYCDEDYLHIFDIDKEMIVETPSVLNNIFKSDDFSIDNSYNICSGNDDSILIGCSSGIYRYVINENHIEQIIDGTSCSIGNLVKNFRSLECCDDGVIIVGFKDGEVYKYEFDPEYTREITSTLNIYSLDDNDELKQLINKYASSNPNVKVEYQVGHRNGMTYEDALREFSVLMLSGNVPDIIVTEGLDIGNLVEKNMLIDLSQSEDVWDKEHSLLDNIAKWNKSDDGLYCVTTRFRVIAVSAEKSDLKKINSFSEFVDQVEKYHKENNGKYSISSVGSPHSIFQLGFGCEGNSLINENEIDKERMIIFFDDCRRFFKCEEAVESSARDNFFAMLPPEYNFASSFSNNIANKFTLALGTINTFEKDLNFVTSLDTAVNSFNVDYKYGISDQSKLFLPNCTFAITSKSGNKEEAIKFLESAVSKEYQQNTYGAGFPVNRETLEWYFKKSNSSDPAIHSILNNDMDFVDEVKIEYMDDSEVNVFQNYINNLDEPLIMDYSVISIIENSALKCMADQLSSIDAANEVERQLNLKMKE
jgi:hypothetical protein